MFLKKYTTTNKDENYEIMLLQLKSLIEDEKDPIANLANSCALFNTYLDDINWVGFYLLKDDQLVLGPFQGLPACTRIQIGKGVCGNAVYKKETILVNNVHEFKGHIACDNNSKSELVIPLFKNNSVVGVLDIDAPIYNRFDEIDKEHLEKACKIIEIYI